MEETLFSLTNTIALIGWLFLAIAPHKRVTEYSVPIGIVSLLGLCYTWLIFTGLKPDDFNNFSTLEGLMGLFSEPRAVLAGWIHYLAFDLMTGWFIVKDGQKHGIAQLLLLPSLFFTFMLGPFGLLLYYLTRLYYQIRKKA